MFVTKVVPFLIKNSRGERTIQIDLYTYEGRFRASAPSGKSKGKYEVASYNNYGIDKSLTLIKHLSKHLVGKNFMIGKLADLAKLKRVIHRFESHHGELGGNITYALESVFLKAAAKAANKEVWEFIRESIGGPKKVKIPMPVGNCIGGGLHSKKINGRRPDFQEFLLIPNEKSFSRAVTLNVRAQHYAQRLIKSRKRNDEGAILNSLTNEEALEVLRKVADKFKLRIGLDIAASTFYDKGYYHYTHKSLQRDAVDQRDYVEQIIKKYKIFYVEDPMDEEDFSGFKSVLGGISKNRFNSLIVGDDLSVTNPKLVGRAIKSKAMNAMIIKPNQIGSILEVAKVVELCKKNKITMIFSHRSGETMDNILADYCMGFGGDYIKCGIHGKERLIKMKRIIDIEKSL